MIPSASPSSFREHAALKTLGVPSLIVGLVLAIIGAASLLLGAYGLLPQAITFSANLYYGVGAVGLFLAAGGFTALMLYKKLESAQQPSKPILLNPKPEEKKTVQENPLKTVENNSNQENPLDPLEALPKTTLTLTSLRPVLTATVYVNNDQYSGYIADDKRFEFSKHLKDANGNAILPAQDDFYVRIAGTTTSGQNYEDTLPSTLFKSVREGWTGYLAMIDRTPLVDYQHPLAQDRQDVKEMFIKNNTLRFYKDDELIELICDQSTENKLCLPFEWTIKLVKMNLENRFIPFVYPEDLDEKPNFLGMPYDTLKSVIYKDGIATVQPGDFSEMAKEQKAHAFTDLEPTFFENGLVFRQREGKNGLSLADVVCFHTTLVNESFLWLFIKHKKENERPTLPFGMNIEEGQFLDDKGNPIPFSWKNPGSTFNTHGFYAVVPLHCKVEETSVGFIKEGSLHNLSIEFTKTPTPIEPLKAKYSDYRNMRKVFVEAKTQREINK